MSIVKYLSQLLRTSVVAVVAIAVCSITACTAPTEEETHEVTVELLGGHTATVDVPTKPQRVISLLSNWTSTLAALDIPITAEFV
ncbi:hypothetical protein [Gordonia sp. NPDC003585]